MTKLFFSQFPAKSSQRLNRGVPKFPHAETKSKENISGVEQVTCQKPNLILCRRQNSHVFKSKKLNLRWADM